jgi:hypothetical protein
LRSIWSKIVIIGDAKGADVAHHIMLHEITRNFLLGVFTVAAAGVVGLAGCDKHKSSALKQQTAVTRTVRQTRPVQQAPDTAIEKQAKLAAMEAYDQHLLATDGYKATARLDYGNCSGSEPTRIFRR